MAYTDAKKESRERKIWLIYSERMSKFCDLLPANQGRQSLVSSLIKAYGLEESCVNTLGDYRASRSELVAYHDAGFIDFLLQKRPHIDKTLPNYKEMKQLLEEKLEREKCEEFGLEHDCYVFPFMDEYVRLVAGSSILSAKTLVKESSLSSQNIVINWYGGRHHCTKRKAAGFCYINDAILAIGLLRKKFRKVFYLDLDLHHGDGVEYGYEYSRNVFTCSIHRFDVGFYPGTGSLKSSQKNKVNIPTKRGLSDATMNYIVSQIVFPLIQEFKPNVIILQCGCDGLGMDTHKEWNMTISGYSKVIESIIRKFNPTPFMLLGGGGYNHTETAKCWTFITKSVIGTDPTWDIIPEHSYLDEYEKDGFRFWSEENSQPLKLKDENDEEYLEEIKSYISSLYN
ncbi:histone deacetylase [Scheffersomyces xylosifermentans]|uniref:histone deacetylase n=1 Tax=Scheffersomyces xylosifermentans TaxID=1304137 RepID=UPI00315D8EFA